MIPPPSVLDRLRCEATLIAAGIDEPLAVRLAAWLGPLRLDAPARAAVHGEIAARLGELAASYDALDGPQLHALAIATAELAARAPHLWPHAIAAQRALLSKAGEAHLEALMDRAMVPASRRAELRPRLASRAIAQLATDDGPHALPVLRSIARGDDVFAAAAGEAIAAQIADAHGLLERRLAEIGAEGPEVAPACFAAVAARDARLGGDRELRRRVVTAWLSVAWPVYTERRWDLLRALLASIDEIVEALALELEGDPAELAYRAAVAQVLVFRSEMASTLSAQIAMGERAHALCPTLRNARVVLAAHLAHRAANERDPDRRERDAHRALTLDPYQRRAREILGRR